MTISTKFWRRALLQSATALAGMTVAATAHAGGYNVTPLVTDDQAVLATLGYGAAPTTDAALVNPWDFANSGTGPWVIANAGGNGSGIFAGTATSYTGTGQVASPTITIPQALGPAHGSMTGPVGPTGDVYVAGAGFKLPGGASAKYIFDNLDGSISGWDGTSSSAKTMIAGRGPGGNLAAYTGLEIATYGGQNLLYAANNITGKIDVFNNALAPVTLPGGFVDPKAGGLVPYNIQALSDGHLWVTYAAPGPDAAKQPLGSGFVDEFKTDGTLVQRFASGGLLDSPWGIAIAPGNFGAYSNDVLIGNFNDNDGLGYISAYDAASRAFKGTLDENGKPIVLPGLWGMQFGSGGETGPTNELYFTAGIGSENHGLFGRIAAVPEPGSWAMLIAGFAIVGAMVRRQRQPDPTLTWATR